MPKFLRIKEWETYQHYKNRNPAWIKLHKRLLDDYEFHRLPDASKALAPMLWLLASESKDVKEGSIPMDFERIGFRLRREPSEVEQALNPLIAGGFVTVYDDASGMLASVEHDSIPEKRREEIYTEEKEGKEISLELLDQYQITPKLLEELGLPQTQQNYRYGVAAVICAKAELKGTPHQAYEFILQQATISRADEWVIDCFWLNDAKFFPRNRTGKGHKPPEVKMVSAWEQTKKILENG